MIIQTFKLKKNCWEWNLEYQEENQSLTEKFLKKRKILHLPLCANSALEPHILNAQEIADNICIHLASLLSGTHTCLHLLFTDKVSILKWVAVSIYLCWNNHLVFIFFLWKNVHETILSNLTTWFIHSFSKFKGEWKHTFFGLHWV